MAIADKLTDTEREATLRLMVGLAVADGKLTDGEVKALQRMAAGLRVSHEELLEEASEVDLAAEREKLHRPVAAKVAVMCLVELAFADGEYAQVERDMIIEQVDLLGVDIELLDRIESWVQEGIAWERDADAILE